MKLLEEKIRQEGQVIGTDILKVDMFLNHQIDVNLLDEMGKEFYRLFKDKGINKILTVESSGIAIAVMAAKYFNVPVVFAKKTSHKNVGNEVYSAHSHSFTHGKDYEMIVSKKYLSPADNILFIDDFLAGGNAAFSVLDILKQSGANLVGIGIAIEKGFQDGGKKLREMGIELQSLAIVEGMDEDDGVSFRMQNAECRMQNAECRVQNAECRMQNAECRMQSAECRMQNAECRVQNAECRMQNAECRVQNAECRMQNAECRMQNAECRVLSAECRMQSAECRVQN